MNWIKETNTRNREYALSQKNVRWFCSILILIALLFMSMNQWRINFLGIGLLVYCFFGLIFPIVIFPFLYGWMWVSSLIGELISTMFLGVIYFVIFTPVSFFVRRKNDSGWSEKAEFSSFDKQY